MPQRHFTFEWDPEKARSNLRKHKVSFETAEQVLADPDADRFHLEEYDDAHSRGESRWITVGSLPHDRNRFYCIAWTPRGPTTRIISARKATRTERSRHATDLDNF